MTNNVNTYNGLLQAIPQWVNRNDTVFIANVPLFISLAEQQFFYDCPILGTENYISGTFNPGSNTVSKPALWGQTLTFSYLDADGNRSVLNRVSYEYILKYIDNPSSVPNTLVPKYYSDYGYDYFILAATPQTALNYEIAYFQKIQPLSTTNQVNWITQYAYDTFFYSCLHKAYLFIDNGQDAQVYDQMYQKGIQMLTNYDQGRRFDRNSNVTKG